MGRGGGVECTVGGPTYWNNTKGSFGRTELLELLNWFWGGLLKREVVDFPIQNKFW